MLKGHRRYQLNVAGRFQKACFNRIWEACREIMGSEWWVSENMLYSCVVFVQTSTYLAQDSTKNAKAKEARSRVVAIDLVKDLSMPIGVKRMQGRCPCSGICFLVDQGVSEYAL